MCQISQAAFRQIEAHGQLACLASSQFQPPLLSRHLHLIDRRTRGKGMCLGHKKQTTQHSRKQYIQNDE